MIQSHLSHHTITSGNINLHVVTAGPETGKPLMLLHGFPEFWYGWRHQIDTLVEAGYRLIIPDQRGYNKSDKPSAVKDYSISILSQDVMNVMDHFSVSNASLVSHDWGAVIGWWLANQHPDRFEKLVVMNVPHPVVMQKFLYGSLAQIRKSWYIFAFQIPWLPEKSFAKNNGLDMSKKLRKTGLPGTFSDEDLQRYREAWAIPNTPTGMINWYRAALRYKPRAPKDPTITIPTLMIWGKKDIALGHEMAQPSIDLCTDGQLIMIDDATHWVQHDAKEQVNQALLTFLQQ